MLSVPAGSFSLDTPHASSREPSRCLKHLMHAGQSCTPPRLGASPRRACLPALSQELRTFFSSLLHASRGTDPIIESGNKYGKTDVSHRMNGALLMPLPTALALALAY